jgi:adenosylhomocysteine nucleosidase
VRLYLVAAALGLKAVQLGLNSVDAVLPRNKELREKWGDAVGEYQRFGGGKAAAASRFLKRVNASSRQKQLDGASLVDEACQLIDHQVAPAHSLVDVTTALLDPYGRTRSLVTFTSALLVSRSDGIFCAEFDLLAEQLLIDHQGRSAQERVRIERGQVEGAPDCLTILGVGNAAAEALGQLAVMIVTEASSAVGVRAALVPALDEYHRVYLGSPNTVHYGEAFAPRMQEILEHKAMTPGPGSRISIFGDLPVMEAFGERCRSNLIRAGRASVMRNDEEQVGSWSVRQVEVKDKPPQADIGIVTIVTEEQAALERWLKRSADYDSWVDSAGQYWHTASVAGHGQILSVVATQAMEQGERSVLNAHHAMSPHRPRLLVLLGIGGSIHKDAQIGDVVLATDIVDYQRGAETEQGLQRRGRGYVLPAPGLHAMNRFFVAGEREPRPLLEESTDHSKPAGFSVHRGPIGTGAIVEKYRDGPTRQWLLGFNDKTLVMETEAAATAAYFHEQAARDGVSAYLVVRGVSDRADVEKDDLHRVRASRNAVQTLSQLLRDASEILLPSR